MYNKFYSFVILLLFQQASAVEECKKNYVLEYYKGEERYTKQINLQFSNFSYLDSAKTISSEASKFCELLLNPVVMPQQNPVEYAFTIYKDNLVLYLIDYHPIEKWHDFYSHTISHYIDGTNQPIISVYEIVTKLGTPLERNSILSDFTILKKIYYLPNDLPRYFSPETVPYYYATKEHEIDQMPVMQNISSAFYSSPKQNKIYEGIFHIRQDLQQYSVTSILNDERAYGNYHTYVEGGEHQLTKARVYG